MKRERAVEKLFKPIAECPTQAVLTNRLQIADVMEWVLEQTGKCQVVQTTYSISEEFLRRMFFISKKFGLESMTLILDNKAMKKAFKYWIFIDRVFTHVHIAENHSKLLLFILPDGRTVTVISSQNLTRGDRQESYVVTTDPLTFDSLFSSLSDIIEYHSIPLDELLRNRITTD